MNFEKYPFERLSELLEGISPNGNYELSILTIGEPKFETPAFIQKVLILLHSLHLKRQLKK